MDDLVYCQTFSFFIWLLFDYVNLKSLIIFCIFFVDIYVSFDISVSLSTVSEEFCGNVVVILLILLTIKSPVACAFLWIVSLDGVLSAYVADCIAWSRRFWLYLLFKTCLYFCQRFYPYPYQKTKIRNL